jgi:hypothetical protein
MLFVSERGALYFAANSRGLPCPESPRGGVGDHLRLNVHDRTGGAQKGTLAFLLS